MTSCETDTLELKSKIIRDENQFAPIRRIALDTYVKENPNLDETNDFLIKLLEDKNLRMNALSYLTKGNYKIDEIIRKLSDLVKSHDKHEKLVNQLIMAIRSK